MLLKNLFTEFLNRIDDIVIFNSLDKKHMLKIIEIELDKVVKRINKLGFEINISRKAKEFLVEKGYDKKYGARPLNRAIQKYLDRSYCTINSYRLHQAKRLNQN